MYSKGKNHHPSTITTLNPSTESSKHKHIFHPEPNVFDKLISTDVNDNGLVNDVYENELKINSIKSIPQPTPVTLANIYGGKKNRKIKHEGIRVLIDTGCSHSIMLGKYCLLKGSGAETASSVGGTHFLGHNIHHIRHNNKKGIHHCINLVSVAINPVVCVP